MKEQKLTTEFLGYIAGIIVFTIVGGNIQMKKAVEEGSDAFAEGQ